MHSKTFLFVVENWMVGGLETRIREEIAYLSSNGHKVYLATSDNVSHSFLPKGLVAIYSDMNFDPKPTVGSFCETVDRLRFLIRSLDISCVCVHPFLPVIPAFVAASLENVCLIYTIHGPSSCNMLPYGEVCDFLYRHVVLPNVSELVCVSDELIQFVQPYAEQNCRVVPNAISIREDVLASSGDLSLDPRWLVVSRLEIDKIDGIWDFIVKGKKAGIVGVVVAGDGSQKQSLFKKIESAGLLDFVEFYGAIDDVRAVMPAFAGVAGVGRVVLEGISCKKAVCLIGRAGVNGLITSDNVSIAAAANFSGRNLAVVEHTILAEQIKRFNESLELLKYVNIHHLDRVVWEDAYSIEPPLVKSSLLTQLYFLLKQKPIEYRKTTYLFDPEVWTLIGDLVYSPRYFTSQLSAVYERLDKRDSTLLVEQAACNEELKRTQEELRGTQEELIRCRGNAMALE